MNVQHILTSALRAGGEYTVESAHVGGEDNAPTALEVQLAMTMLTEMSCGDELTANARLSELERAFSDVNRVIDLSTVAIGETYTDMEQREALSELSTITGTKYTTEDAKKVVENAKEIGKKFFEEVDAAAERLLKSNEKRLANIKIIIDDAVSKLKNTDDEVLTLTNVKFSPNISVLLASENKANVSLAAGRVNDCIKMLSQINDGGKIALGDLRNAPVVFNPFFLATAKQKFGTPPQPAVTNSPYWNLVVTEGGEDKFSSLKFVSAGHEEKVDVSDIKVKDLSSACNAALALYPKVLECLKRSGKSNPVKLEASRMLWTTSIYSNGNIRAIASVTLGAERAIVAAMLNALAAAAIVANSEVNSNIS